jgi:hypothetical protein
VKRRDLLALIADAAALSPLGVSAQQKAMPVISYLAGGSPGGGAAFHQGLIEAGYVEGQSVAIDTAGPRVTMIGCLHWPPTSSAGKST